MAAARVQERRLGGGNLNPVTRIGDTVRRPVGRHTAAVHALLVHLRAAGFDGAPEPLGVDDRSREVLTYVPGRIHMPRRDGPLGIDAAVVAAGRLIRAFRNASGPATLGTVAPESRARIDPDAWTLQPSY